MKKIRLDKLISNMGYGSRSEIKKYIKQNRVRVNEDIAKTPNQMMEDGDKVIFDGKIIEYKEFHYYILNKPQGVISATEDKKDKTVIDLLETRIQKLGLFPVGRLDKDTEGLLVLTNDGALSYELLSPKKHVPKVYYVELESLVTDEDIKRIEEGMELDDFTAMPGEFERLEDGKAGFITIHEGKFHQVKKMFIALDNEVEYLQRVKMGGLELDPELGLGEYRELSDEELERLKE